MAKLTKPVSQERWRGALMNDELYARAVYLESLVEVLERIRRETEDALVIADDLVRILELADDALPPVVELPEDDRDRPDRGVSAADLHQRQVDAQKVKR